MRKLVLVALVGSVLPLISGRARACTCEAQSTPMAQRHHELASADLVFTGRVIRQRSLRSPRWACDFDVTDAPPPKAGCLRVRTLGADCEPWKGVTVDLTGPEGKRRRGYSSDMGIVEFCELADGTYRVVSSASRWEPVVRELVVHGKGQTEIMSPSLVRPRVFFATFVVEHVTKGKHAARIEVRSWENDGSCGFGPFEEGRRYEVFATSGTRWPPANSRSVTGHPPMFDPSGVCVVDLCGGTRLLADEASVGRPTA